MTYEKVLDLAVPYLEEYPKSRLMELVKKYPKFEEDFNRQMTPEYKADIEKKGIYFVINDNSWKRRRGGYWPPITLRLGYVGKEELPLLSIDV